MQTKTKYKSQKVLYDGIWFQSKDEMLYYQMLLSPKYQVYIKKIELQPSFVLIPNFVYKGMKRKGITYTADFRITRSDGSVVIVDVKGMETQQGIIRRKLFEYQYPDENLLWVSRSLKYGEADGWINYDKLKKCRAVAKKVNKKQIKITEGKNK